METIEKSIEVEVPIRTAYNQWTQFESFPQFMEGIKRVIQVDSTHLQWKAEIAGKEKEWTAEITEQIPDQKILWKSTSGVQNDGMVTFHKIDSNRTKVMLTITYETDTTLEALADFFGVLSRRIEGDLKRFKKFIEVRGSETGAWRGEVEHGKTDQSYQIYKG